MSERWCKGVWLGKRWRTDEHRVALEDGEIYYTRSVLVLDDGEVWDPKYVNYCKVTPWNKRNDEGNSEEAHQVIKPYTPSEKVRVDEEKTQWT